MSWPLIKSQMILVRFLSPYVFMILFNIILPYLSRSLKRPSVIEADLLKWMVSLYLLQVLNSWHWKIRVSFFAIYIYTFQRDTQCSCTDCLLILRCQLYMFRTVTVHPQELLFRYCMCGLWYVLIRPAGTVCEEELFPKRCTSGTYQVVRFLPHTIVCTYSI